MSRLIHNERGQGSIELALVIPVLILFACVIADMTAFASTWTSADQAATEAVRVLVVDSTATDADCRAAALAASPNLDASHTDVAISRSAPSSEDYEHHLHGSDGFTQRPSHVQTAAVTATVSVEAPWLTPIGTIIGVAAGMPNGVMKVTATKQAAVDTTVTGGGW